jgi:Spy/CpxP family protein refolding chaperone
LTEAQKTDINGIVKDYRTKMMDLRSTMEKADKEVAAAFGENPVDQKKANDAIEKLAASRGELTRTLSQMSLKLRMVLTADQWQDLQQRSAEGRNGRGKGRGRRTDETRSGQGPPSAAKQ